MYTTHLLLWIETRGGRTLVRDGSSCAAECWLRMLYRLQSLNLNQESVLWKCICQDKKVETFHSLLA